MQRIRYVSFPLPPPFFPSTLFSLFPFFFLISFFFVAFFLFFTFFFFSPFFSLSLILFFLLFFFSSAFYFLLCFSFFFLPFIYFFFFSSLPLFHWSHRGATLQRHTSKLQGWSWQEIYKIQQRQVCKILPWENLSTWSGLVASPRGLDKTRPRGWVPCQLGWSSVLMIKLCYGTLWLPESLALCSTLKSFPSQCKIDFLALDINQDILGILVV